MKHTNNKNMKADTNDDEKTGKNASASKKSESNNQQVPLLEKLFLDMLKDIYGAEKQLIKALPVMKQSATTEALQDAFEEHLYQTQKHVSRLEKVFKRIGKTPEAKECEAMKGLVREAEVTMKETKEGSMTRDVALIIAAQKVEHYEIATYGSLVQLALTMGLHDSADILDDTLMEETQTDQLLTDIAESFVNVKAEQEGEYSWAASDKRSQDTVAASA